MVDQAQPTFINASECWSEDDLAVRDSGFKDLADERYAYMLVVDSVASEVDIRWVPLVGVIATDMVRAQAEKYIRARETNEQLILTLMAQVPSCPALVGRGDLP